MADLFHKQAKQYSETRPSYPDELIQFIRSKTPDHHLAWDVGTGSGQAATSLAGMYRNVIATDTSQKQLDFAPKLPNVRWICTAPNMSMAELQRDVVAEEASVDLITIAQALHWIDLPTFYQQARWVLKKPHGVIAAWCYTVPQVNDTVDLVFRRFYSDSDPYWDPARKLVDDQYRSIDFPFEPLDGTDHTGPFSVVARAAYHTSSSYFSTAAAYCLLFPMFPFYNRSVVHKAFFKGVYGRRVLRQGLHQWRQ